MFCNRAKCISSESQISDSEPEDQDYVRQFCRGQLSLSSSHFEINILQFIFLIQGTRKTVKRESVYRLVLCLNMIVELLIDVRVYQFLNIRITVQYSRCLRPVGRGNRWIRTARTVCYGGSCPPSLCQVVDDLGCTSHYLNNFHLKFLTIQNVKWKTSVLGFC